METPSRRNVAQNAESELESARDEPASTDLTGTVDLNTLLRPWQGLRLPFKVPDNFS